MTEIWHSSVKTINPINGEQFVNVEFLAEDGSVATVPLLWIRNKRIGKKNDEKAVLAKCYWPPKGMKRNMARLVSTQRAPDSKTWHLHDVEILQYFCKIEITIILACEFSGTRVWKREIISRLLLGARPFSQVKPGTRLFSRLYLGKNHRFQPLAWEAVGKRLFPRLRDLPTASQTRVWKRQKVPGNPRLQICRDSKKTIPNILPTMQAEINRKPKRPASGPICPGPGHIGPTYGAHWAKLEKMARTVIYAT
ncbi:Collagen alpha-1(XVIII) chain [Frankliniella fusca]|uniref:Collagen alpha-1(XVIII) chain n=1 Tax=Frankliniella fusca TaxID=407009 RepID=A0AAE1I1U6_9NEOP|nr:Collagen alpha-1(XVIII) chain [Frankliniella fusca]